MSERIEIEVPKIVCSKCGLEFVLCWEDWPNSPQSIKIRSCDSGGVYAVTLVCPHCRHEVEL